MGKLLVQCCISVLIWWALGLLYAAAERQYFIPARNLSWDGARNHCQICFKELVTLTPDNSHLVTNMLRSEHWIGLRKNFNSTVNSSMPWSQWANGDPLFFQNWLPGRPVLKSPAPKIDCCSCSCTCPANTAPERTTPSPFLENLTDFTNLYDFANQTNTTTFWEAITGDTTSYTSPSYPTTGAPLKIESTCERTPLVPKINETETKKETYIEDSCVAMLPSGPWVEKSCLELLPFVCYEDRFFGQVNVSDVTSDNATLRWLNATGDISHYRVEITGSKNGTDMNTLTYVVDKLTPGKLYEVQVFPVKCGRDLNPQNASFYTVPKEVKDLNVRNVTETSATLSWNKPEGELNFYLIKTGNKTKKLERGSDGNRTVVVDGLIPGGLYTFTVLTGVLDESRCSEESNVTTNTKPGKVSALTVSDNTNQSVRLSWTAPEGNFTGFRVNVVCTNTTERYFLNQDDRSLVVEGLPSGRQINLSVTTLANYTTTHDYKPLIQEGDTETVINYTTPGPISDLMLDTNESSLNAFWKAPVGSFSSFLILLKLDGDDTTTAKTTDATSVTFSGLKNSAKYTVVVYAVTGEFRGPPVQATIFTKPTRPKKASAISNSTSSITFKWDPPDNVATPSYHVTLNSTLWNYTTSVNTTSTNYTFTNLTSGTKYDFRVTTLAGGHESEPTPCSDFTVPKKVEISLSMMCVSAEPFRCDNSATTEEVHEKLKQYFKKTLGENVVWELP